jgi:YD repeat-containing protein
MTSIIGGYDTGLFDSSLFLLNRNDKTAEGTAGHGEELYVNIASGNLVVMHKDAYLPSQGEDYYLTRTYNSRGTWGSTDGPGWSNSTMLELSQITSNKITLVNADTSRFVFSYDAASDSYISVDGAGAYEVIKQDKLSKAWVLTKSDQTVLSFDSNGDIKTSRDTNGNLVTYTFGQGKLQSLKDDTGHTISYLYSNGNLVKLTDEVGTVLVQYEYTQNLLTAVIDREGHRTAYQYYTDGTIKSITLPATSTERQRVLQFAYDPNPIDSTGKTRLLRWLTDAEGNKTYFEYQFNVDNFSKYNGGSTTVLNALGLNRRESNAAEYVEWRTANGLYATWDANRYATDAGFKAQADQITQRHTVTYAYNAFGAITSVVDQAGYKTAYQYDAKENLTAITDANGFAITTSDASYWRQLRAEYGFVDLAGQGRLAANLTAADVAALQARYTTRLEYDARGNLTRKTDNLGNVNSFTYASFNKVTSQTAAMGHALADSNEASVQDKRVELGYARDASLLTDSDRAALRALYTTTYTYDARQNVSEMRSPGGDLTRFEYDSFGNVAKRIVFLDANNLTDPAKQQVTQYFYDAFGQNIRTVDAEGFTTLKTFDHFGNVLSSIDGRGNVTRFTYDADNRLLTVTSPEGNLTTYSYDSVGNRIAVRDANGHSVLYVYDRNNLLVTTIDPKDGDAAGNRITSAAYDVVGNRTKAVDAEGRVTTYVYREDNRLLEVRTPAVQNASGTGNASYTTSYAYDGIGQQIAVTDHNGNRTDFVFDEGNLLKRRTDAIGNVTEYRHDANLNQIQVVIGAQLATERRRVLRFSFDEEDQKIAEADALGGQVRYALDAVGNVVATTDANGHQTEYRFDRNNRLVTETKAEVLDGTTGTATRHTVTHQYDGNGNAIATTDENGHTSRLTFDRDNRLVMVQDANGIQTVFTYDSRNNRTSIQVGVEATADANGKVTVTSTANAQVQTFGYDEFNRLVSQIDGVGNALVSSDSALYAAMRQDMGYAAAVANLSSADKQAILAAYTDRLVYDKVDNLVTRTDHEGRVTRMAYDGLNRMTSRTDALGQTALMRYDGNGNLVGRTDELGRVTGASYDAVNRLVSQTDALGVVTTADYDNVGNLLARTQAAGTGDERVTRFEYDLNNRLVRDVDAEGAARAYEYDAVGNRLKVVDKRGNATRYIYDARDRVIKTIDPLGFETRVEYDGVGNQVTLVDARGGITRLAYDAGNRRIQATDAEGRVTRLDYDVRGNRITQHTAFGTAEEQVTAFEYDAQNNLRAVVDAAGGRSENAFDRVYNRTVAVDANGHATTYAFDALNRQVSVLDAEGLETRYAYDAVGNRLAQTDALGRVTTWSYDADNRVTTMTAADGVVTQYAYDAVDNRVAMTRALGLAEQQLTTFRYDRENRLLEQVDALGHATRFEYDANGNAVTTVDALGFRTAYDYDANNRVISISDPLGNMTRYGYDGNGNRVQVIDARGFASTSYYNADNELVLAVDNEGYATSYRYDGNGNVTAQTRHALGVALPLDPAVRLAPDVDPRDQTIQLAYDRLNRVVQRTDGEGFVSRLAYDAVGNLLATTQFLDLAQTRGEVTRSWYDAVNRQVARLSAEGYLTETAYDAVGNAVLVTRRDAAVQAPADGSRPVAAAGDAGVATAFVYDALNRLVRETDALGTHTDATYNARGDRTSETRAAGTADARRTEYRYDVAGRLTDQVNALGVVTHFDLDAVGSIVARHDAFGTADAHVTGFAYDGNRRLVRQTDALGMVTAMVYDANGNVVARTVGAETSLARTERFEYDRNNRLAARVSPMGERTTYAYDATGNRVQETDALGRFTDYAFDRVNRQVREMLAATLDGTTGEIVRHTRAHAYDGAGNRIATTDENGHTSRLHYDLENRLVMTEDANGVQSVQSFDARNNVLTSAVGVQAHVDAAGRVVVDSVDAAQVQTLRYDAVNRQVTRTDGVGEALAGNDGALYRVMRVELGYAAAAADLSQADRDALRALYTDTHAYDRVGNRLRSTDHLGRTTSTTYDLLNRAVQRTDAAGGIESFQYDAHDRLVARTDALGRVTTATYDAVNRLVSQSDALGVVTHSAYDLVGNLLARTEAAGTAEARVTRYEYDLNNRVVRDTDAEGAVRSYEYDAVGNRLRLVDGRGNATRHVYDARDRVIKTIDPLGFETRMEYDGVGNRVTLVDARGGITRVDYDAGNRLIQTTDAEQRVTRFEYDVRGNRVTQRTAAGTADEQVTRFEYDAQNNLRAVVDGEGARTENGFDRVYNRTSVSDGNGHVTHYEFDALNRQVRMVDAAGQQTLLAYDAVGNTLSQTDALGRVTRYAYDADSRLTTVTAADGVVTTYAYDAVDNRIALTRAAGLPQQQLTVYGYDHNGRLLFETDAQGHTKRHEYDANGNVVATIDALGQRTGYTYDANNRVVAIADPLGRLTQYRYDGNGNRVQVIDALGQASTTYFNADNEVTLSVNAAGEATTFHYDANGNVTAQVRHAVRVPAVQDPAVPPIVVSDAADQATRYAYDHVNRAVRTLDAEGGLVDSRYDAVGNLVAVTAYAGKVSLSSSQSLSTLGGQPGPQDRLTRHAYDAVNRRVETVDAEGYSTRFEYDAVGNRAARTLFLSKTDFTSPELQQRSTAVYDAVNRLVAETNGIGVQTAYAYDALGNLVVRTDAANTADARGTSYSYDAANRRIGEVDALGTATRHAYDAADRLVFTVRGDGQPEARSTSYGYDAANRLVDTVRADGSAQRRVYDALGRVVEQLDAAGSADQRSTTYTYDRADRVIATVVGAGTPEALATTAAYDAFGNRTRTTVAEGTSSARVMRYAYDHLDRLIAQTDGNGIVTLNDYDAFGNRVATSIEGTTQTALGTTVQRTWSMTFAYDGRNLLVGESDGAGNLIRREYDGAGNLRFQRAGEGSAAAQLTEFNYDLANRLMRKTVDPTGLAIATQFQYDARGNLVAQVDADGIASRTRFDALDRAVVTTDGEGFSVSFAYDRFGNQTAITTGQYLLSMGDLGYDAVKEARALPATTLLAYDAMDRKVLQADALGTVTRYAYDLRGNRTQMVEAAGQLAAGATLSEANLQPLAGTAPRTSSYSYDSADRLVDEVQPAGTVVHRAYNAAGEQTAKVVDFGAGAQHRNATTRYFYDAGGRLAFEADPIGTVTQTVYDGFGNVIRTVRGLALDSAGQPSSTPTADMRVTAYEYDAVNRKTADVVDPHGLALRTGYEYDVRGRQTAVVDANGSRTDMAYDAADRMTWSRDGEGFVTAFASNGRGLRTAETRYATNAASLPAGAVPAASNADRHSTVAYDAAGRVAEVVDPRGVVTLMAHDAIGNRIATIENATGLYGSAPRVTTQTFNAANLATSKTEASGLVCEYSYDGVYNMVERREQNSWQGTVQVQVTGYAYDLNNRLSDEIVDPAGLNLHKAYRYDTLGNRVAETSANGFAAAEANPAQRQAILDAYTKRTWFDAASRAVLTVDENGNAQSAQYDAVGNVVRTTQHATTLSLAQRQALDDLTPAMLAPSGADRSTDRVLDKADREVLVRAAAARQAVGQVFFDEHRAETHTSYDAVGNVVSTVDGNGNTSYAYYDANNRLRGRMDAEGYLTVLTLDAFGNAVEERLTLDRPTLSAPQKAALDLDTYVLQGEVRLVTRAFDAADHEVLTVLPASELLDSHGSGAATAQVVRSVDAFGQIASESTLHRADVPAAATLYRYDAAGRLVAKVDPQAGELLTIDTPEVIGLRKQLGYVNASGAGKLAAELTEADRSAIAAAYTCDYTYDAKGNVREQVEAGRVTSFAYDAANRSVAVQYPAARRTEVDANGTITVTENYRAEGRRVYDANGNVVTEIKSDGERIDYRFDAGNRMVAALNDGVFIGYTYNFAGDLTRTHRYYNAAGSVDAPPPPHGLQDQVIERVYDRLGRRVAEIQLGNPSDGSDDRVTRSAYDANGNQVQNTDARGATATLVYDALNRITDTINREGGVTGSDYDALGNVIARRTGGFDAPHLVGGVSEELVSDSGALISWSTDHGTDAQVEVRAAGTSEWTVFGAPGAYTLDHVVRVSGLAADTVYEYRFKSKDAFGYEMTSGIRTLRTSVGLPPVAVSDVRQVATGWQAQVSFSLPPGAGAPIVRVGAAGADPDIAIEGAVFNPVQQADGSYTVALAYENADASFQVEWTDATGVHRTGASTIQQRVDTRRLDATVKATPQGEVFNLAMSWNLADVLAEQGIAFATTPEGPSYSVYMGFTLTEGQTPNWTQATLEGGLFKVNFANLAEGARTLYLQYVEQDGGIVNATPIALAGLAGTDLRFQNLELDFPDVELAGTEMAVRTRKVGDTSWTPVPQAAVKGTSVNLLGLAAGEYEYEATLSRNGEVLRNASGQLELREPASLTGLRDTLNPQATVEYTLTDAALTIPSLADETLGPDESVTFELKDEQDALVNAQFADGVLDVAAQTPGSYTLLAKKIRTTTTTTTSGTPPVTTTTTTTTVLSQLEATLVVGPLTLSNVEAQELSGTRTLATYAPGATVLSATVNVSVNGTSSSDRSWSFFDVNGRRTFSNEEGGVWTRYFHDAAGNVTKEVRFQRRDANGQFINAITSGDRPGEAQLQADYEAAVAAHAAGADTARIKLRSYDAANNLLLETELTNAHGAVTTRVAWDRFKNRIVETVAEGIAGLENTVRSSYDGANRLVHTVTGPFEYTDAAGNIGTRSAEESYGYDASGYQTVHVDSRGFAQRRHYDAYGRVATEWDGEGNGRASTLRTEYSYDGFDRVVQRRAFDLTGRGAQGVQVTQYEWSAFDQQVRVTDAMGQSISRTYDANGNAVSETDAKGATAHYQYDSEGRITARIDRLGGMWTTAYDAYGQRLSETDANGRVTTYTMGAFGQVLGSQTYFTRGYTMVGANPIDVSSGSFIARLIRRLLASLQAARGGGNVLLGAGSSSEAMRYDWNGRLAQSTDSFGKNQVFTYNDADDQVRIDDLALGKAAGYQYDALGRRTHETLDRGGITQRDQTYTYNNQGWLSSVVADAGFDSGGGASLGQTLNVTYRFDAAGNRVQVNSNGVVGQYAYDASGRMVQAVDDKGASTDAIHDVQYDGYGNRVLENRNGTFTGYSYDAANRVVSSTAGEQWSYDANGNALFQRNRDGSHSSTQVNAENRATVTTSVGTDGKATTSTNTYDAVGNVVNTRVDGNGFGFDEVTRRDVRYLETAKNITNSHANGAKGLEGATSFQYDANGNLTVLDRGRRQSGGNNVAFFDYDIDGHIIGRADKATTLTNASYFETFDWDPGTGTTADEYGGALSFLASILARQGGASNSTHLQSYIYANNKPIAEAAGDLQTSTKRLTLIGGTPVYDNTPLTDASEPQLLGWDIVVRQSDLRFQADGVTVDRAATAKAIAARAYDGWTSLSETAQDKVAAYVLEQLPATVAANSKVRVKPYIMVADSQLTNATQITDYSYREIGASNPGGSVQNHVVRAGDTLQSIAAMYFGSPAYWYLVADANGLTGSEPLTAGTTLKIPNAVANSVNDAETFKVYNESEIIGSTSPEIRTIKKKKKWYQKLIQIVIIVVMIVAAVFTGGLAMGAYSAVAATSGVLLGTLAAVAVGVAGMVVANVLTQGLAIAAGLQEKFSWKAVGKAAVSGIFVGLGGAISAAYAPAQAAQGAQVAANAQQATTVINLAEVATRVGVEVVRQQVVDGKINSIAGLLGAAAAGGAFKEIAGVGKIVSEYARTFGAGLGILEAVARGKADNAMNWVSLATSALFDTEKGAADPRLSPALADAADINWGDVAVQAVGTAVVWSRRGEDAGLNYIGSAIGNGLVETSYIKNAVAQAGAEFGNALGQGIVDAANASGPTLTTGDFARADRAKYNEYLNSIGAAAPTPQVVLRDFEDETQQGKWDPDAFSGYGDDVDGRQFAATGFNMKSFGRAPAVDSYAEFEKRRMLERVQEPVRDRLNRELDASAQDWWNLDAKRNAINDQPFNFDRPIEATEMVESRKAVEREFVTWSSKRVDLFEQLKDAGGLLPGQEEEMRLRRAERLVYAMAALGGAPLGGMTSQAPMVRKSSGSRVSVETTGSSTPGRELENLAPHLQAERNGFPGVKVTQNGGPTFVGTEYLYPVAPGQRNIVEITMTGSRIKDFEAANRLANLLDRIPDSANAPKDYVWHHVDDFDPLTGRTTLELIRRDAHRAVIPHSGSVRQYEVYYRTTYKD